MSHSIDHTVEVTGMSPRLHIELGEPRGGSRRIERLWVIIRKKKRFCGIHGSSK